MPQMTVMTINWVMLKGISIDIIFTGCPLSFKCLIAGNCSAGAIFGAAYKLGTALDFSQ
jgi:hypothetical protein